MAPATEEHAFRAILADQPLFPIRAGAGWSALDSARWGEQNGVWMA